MSKTEDYPIEGQVLDEDTRNRSACVASIFSSQKFANQSNALTVNNWFAVWTHFETEHVNTFLDYPPGDPEGTQQSLIRRGPTLRSDPYPFIPF